MRLLVSGAAGFVGAELLRRLAVDPRIDVVALSRDGEGSAGDSPEGRITWLAVDLAKPGFARALPGELDAVVHLAQSSRYRDFPAHAGDVVDVNLGSTARLLEHARASGAERFVLASTATVYAPSERPLTEGSPLELGSIYAASKRAAELLLEPYAGLLSCLALRLFTVYGAGQRRQLIADLIERVRAGRAVQLQGEDGLSLSPIHVSDVAAALRAAVHQGPAPTGILNLGGEEALGLRAIAAAIGDAVGREPRFESLGPGSSAGWVADRTAFEAAFPELDRPLSFSEGIGRTVAEVPAQS